MITKVVPTGNCAGGLLRYLMDEKKDFEIIGGNIVGQNYSQIMRQWRAISQQNPRTDKDTKHITLSPHAFDRITKEQWQEIGEFMVSGLGYTNNLWVLITHKPTESQLQKNPDAPPHVHIMVNTIECEKFTRISDWKDQFRAELLTREIEKQFNIVPVAPSLEAGERALPTGQKRRMLREEKELLALQPNPKIKLHLLQTTGFPTWQYNEPEPPVQTKLNNLCTIASCDRPPLTEYISRLKQCDVDVRIATKDGSPVGISYQMDGVSFAGSRINKQFNWNGLQQQGITFDSNNPAVEHYFKELSPKISPKQQLNSLLEAAANNAPTMSCFLNRCEAAGVEVRIKQTRTGKIQGIAYALGEEEIKGSELKGLSFEKLIAAGVTYDPVRDKKAIALAANQYKAAHKLRKPRQTASDTTTASTQTDNFGVASSSKKSTPLTRHDLERLLEFINEIEAHLNQSSQPSLTLQQTPAQAASPVETPEPTQPPIQPSTFQLSLPEDIKAQRAYLKSVYQKFSHLCTKQFSFTRDEDIDVGVALWGFVEQLQPDDIKRILSQSPKVQHLLQQKRPVSEMFDYIEQRVTLAITQRQLQANPELSQRVNLVVPIVSSFFEALPNNQQLEGKNYTLKRIGEIRSVVAKDGHGEVLRLRGRWVEQASLEDKDVQRWQQAQESRIEQQLSPSKPKKSLSKAKRKKQIELD